MKRDQLVALVAVLFFGIAIGWAMNWMPREEHPVHLADLPAKGEEDWMTVLVTAMTDEKIEAIGCPAGDPLYGPAKFEFDDTALINSSLVGAYVPILYVRTGKDEYQYVGFAALTAKSGVVPAPDNVLRSPDTSGGSGDGGD